MGTNRRNKGHVEEIQVTLFAIILTLFGAILNHVPTTNLRTPASLTDPTDCSVPIAKMMDTYDNKDVPVYHIKASPVNLSEMFGMQKEQVILGIMDPHHYYLIVGKDRLEANPMSFPSLQHYDNGAYARNGLLLRIRDISPATMNKIRQELMSSTNTAALSCVNGACRVLKGAGRLRYFRGEFG
ncbi:MAG: hypothetical protein JST16_10210 [Bdellovibrionales bacterium]|nr:hypothetical protein [Bdellovibrionales bacterium]